MDTSTCLINSNKFLLSGLILFLTYIFIIIERIPKVTVALLGASATIMLGLLAQQKGNNGSIDPHYFINYVDFNVLFLLVSMMIIVNIAARSGLFNWIGVELLKLTKGHPVYVLISLGLFTAVFSAFLDNVTTVIIVMPITFAVSKMLQIDPIPFLITEIITSNIGGTATLIGDPPNIIIGSVANFSFMDFVFNLTAIIVLILLVNLFVLFLLFKKSLTANEEKRQKVALLDNTKTITDYSLMKRACFVFAFVLLGFVLHDFIHIQSSVIAMAGASFLLIFENPHKCLKEIEWTTIFFFLGLFIVIGGLEASGGICLFAKLVLGFTQGVQYHTAMVILWLSGFLAGVMGNIPYTVTMTPLILQIQNTMGVEYAYPLWWCLSLGACLGGNLTIIGAAANVIVVETADGEGYFISFIRFIKYGFLSTILSLIISAIYVDLRYLT